MALSFNQQKPFCWLKEAETMSASDLLKARQIRELVFGDPDAKLSEEARKELGLFKLGGRWFGRRSTVSRILKQKEEAALGQADWRAKMTAATRSEEHTSELQSL